MAEHPLYNVAHLHHAYGIIGDAKEVVPTLLAYIKADFGLEPQGNPDFIYEKIESLTIDDSRRIKEIHAIKPFSASTPRFFILEIYGATREAQNALLKMLEEPEEGNHFFLIIPHKNVLLPTVLSRLSLVHATSMLPNSELPGADAHERLKPLSEAPLNESHFIDPRAFLALSTMKKIDQVDKIATDIADEKVPRQSAVDFLNALEQELHQSIGNTPATFAKLTPTFEAIALARNYLGDRSSSIKMVLEYVALSL